MSVFKCKMCGGNLSLEDGSGIAVCEYCGTRQTLSKSGDEVVKNLYNRANSLRLQCEFDRAEEIYEKILAIDETEAEAHWGLVLCEYGIEYVEEPETLKRIPTCHRTSYEAIAANADYLAAIENSDSVQRELYKKEAEAIDKIQRSILDIVKKEKPFDVFICYKETGKDGSRTEDSVIAGAIYDQLTKEGFKVFFAAVTLENKLGEAYEPYIFAALHSARVMLAIGTKPEHLEAVWVKNEWSRYLKLLKSDPGRLLIPCYRDMDAYELPEELSHLQAQDLSKIGAVQDLIRGIRKVVSAEDAKTEARANSRKETVVIQESRGTAESLLKRAFLFLEDKDWGSADRYCEKVLDQDPENAMAYVGKLMAELHVPRQEDLVEVEVPFEDHNNYRKAIRFADDELRNTLENYITQIRERNETERKILLYEEACVRMREANTEKDCIAVSKVFQSLGDFDSAEEMAQECLNKVEKIRSERYQKAVDRMASVDATAEVDLDEICKAYKEAVEVFQTLPGFRDADQLNEKCEERLEAIRKERIYESAMEVIRDAKYEYDFQRAAYILEQIPGWKDADEQMETCRRMKEQIGKKEKRKNKLISFLVLAVIIGGISYFLYAMVIRPEQKYNAAVSLMEAGKYEEAHEAFEELLDGSYIYKDSDAKIAEIELIQQHRKWSDLKEGDVVEFGAYASDEYRRSEMPALEWIVLEKRKNAVLLLSKYCLAYGQYGTPAYYAGLIQKTWEDSKLRTWLNDTFFEKAFLPIEKSWIVPHEVQEKLWRLYESDAEDADTDLVTLLPSTFANNYAKRFPDIKEIKFAEYVYSNSMEDKNWWCRQMEQTSSLGSVMGESGSLEDRPFNDSAWIRPVIWVSLES